MDQGHHSEPEFLPQLTILRTVLKVHVLQSALKINTSKAARKTRESDAFDYHSVVNTLNGDLVSDTLVWQYWKPTS